MLIPRGKPLYENLATSFVLVDALVSDLCEGGFSGVVDIMLSHAQALVVISRGRLAAVVQSAEATRDETRSGYSSYRKTSTAQLAADARRERGRISVYSYSIEEAAAFADRLSAEPLYTNLSTEFADLERMISKLARERDRIWFIEVRAAESGTALIEIRDDSCRVIDSDDAEDPEANYSPDRNSNAALARLLEKCDRAVCSFDVYFKLATDAFKHSGELAAEGELNEQELPPTELAGYATDEPQENISEAVKEAKAIYSSIKIDESADESASGPNYDLEREELLSESILPDIIPALNAEHDSEARAETESRPEQAEPYPTEQEIVSGDEPEAAEAGQMSEETLLIVGEEIRDAGELEQANGEMLMAEIKRLMGDIAFTIEEAIKAVEQRDSFSIYLRAGQLKIANQYPFLDPFGAEFEYLAGEIAFIGRATPEQFIEGLTQAIRLAIEAIAESSSQSSRLRQRIQDDLRWLYDRHQVEFQRYGLDKIIAELISG